MYGLLLDAACDLDSRLFPDANVPARRAMCRASFERHRKDRKTSHGIDIPFVQLLLLQIADACHQRQVIVFPPLRVALGPPTANRTVWCRLRIACSHSTIILNRLFKVCVRASTGLTDVVDFADY